LAVQHETDIINSNDACKHLLSQEIGISFQISNNSVPEQYAHYQNEDTATLNTLNIAKLKEILEAYGQPKSGVKAALIQRVQNGPVKHTLQGQFLMK